MFTTSSADSRFLLGALLYVLIMTASAQTLLTIGDSITSGFPHDAVGYQSKLTMFLILILRMLVGSLVTRLSWVQERFRLSAVTATSSVKPQWSEARGVSSLQQRWYARSRQ